jgi:hypothetical protein
MSRLALGPTQPPIQYVRGALSLGVKWPGREADHSPHLVPSSKNVWSYTSTPSIRLHDVVLITFTLSHLYAVLSGYLFQYFLPPKILYKLLTLPLHATYSTHPIHLSLITITIQILTIK